MNFILLPLCVKLKKPIQHNFLGSKLHQTKNIFKIWQHVRTPEPHVVGFGAPAEARRDQTLTHVYLHRYCAPVKCSTLHLTCQLRNGAVLSRYQNTLLVLQRYPALSSRRRTTCLLAKHSLSYFTMTSPP